MSKPNWPRKAVSESKAQYQMAHTPSQSQQAVSDCQFQKNQPETFLWQLNFPNPIKTPDPFTIKNFFNIEIFRSLCHFLHIRSPFPREMEITQHTAATSLQQAATL